MSEINRFNLVTNGYDCYQVNNEIDRLGQHIQELNERILMYQNQIETANNQFTMIKNRYQLLVSELTVREKQADDVSRLALQEAKKTIDEAQKNADTIIQESVIEVKSYIDKVKEWNQVTTASNREVRDAVANLISALNKYDSIEVVDPFKKD